METKITVCENRFEVLCEELTDAEAFDILSRLANWLSAKKSEDDYMAALGPCGK